MTDTGWDIFDLQTLKAQLSEDAPVSYSQFLNVPAMHCGLYRLRAGSKDMQTPHDEDELYYVIEGHAQLKVGDEIKEVTPGMVLYIRAAEEHSFFEIQEDMLLLVFFSSGSN
jgi:mannose-6-phosphate isomerase-like protein (cupin superfamily)